MLFSSMIFLWAFLPITLGLYYGVHILPISDADLKMKIKNGILLVASLFFYGFGSVKYLLLMIGFISANISAILSLESAFSSNSVSPFRLCSYT